MPQGMKRRAEKALTAALVRTVQKPGKYHDGGGLGFYLRVEKNGARFWIQRITIRGKRRELGLGSPPLVSLADARAVASAQATASSPAKTKPNGYCSVETVRGTAERDGRVWDTS